MPSVPQPTSAPTTAPRLNTLHPSSTKGPSAQASSSGITAQPSPAIISTTSHKSTHSLPRRFLGPMPENVVNSPEVEKRRRVLGDMRRAAIGKMQGAIRRREEEVSGFGEGSEDGRGRLRGVVRRVRVKRFRHGREVEEDVELETEESEGEEDTGRTWYGGSKGKKKRKDVWVGESFDIGREFIPAPRSQRDAESEITPTISLDDGLSIRSTGLPKRPPVSKHSTQETFFTARTGLSSNEGAVASTSSLGDTSGYDIPTNQASSSAPSLLPPKKNRNSQSSSMQPLMSSSPERAAGAEDPSLPPLGRSNNIETSPSSRFRRRLKSAIRKPHEEQPHASTSSERVDGPSISKNSPRPGKSKTVQFPVDLVQDGSDGKGPKESRPRKGNRRPADPGEVLAREGDEVAGTSAGAVEEALEEDEDDDDDIPLPGEVIMRDRMLVRVAHHRDEGLAYYDEASQRRSPCQRMEPMEEYIVCWRKGRVEFYQDWKTSITERIKGYKRLCFVVPLIPSRTTLCLFNSTDLTLSLTTSAGKLQDDVEYILHSNTTRSESIKDRVQQSKQAKWLRHGKRGTHIFLMKLGERSRAIDWFWDIWRDLGGELPDRFEVVVPGLSTSIKLKVPDDDEVGGRTAMRSLNHETVINTCETLLREMVNMAALDHEKREQGGEVDMELAWKGVEGSLDWLSYKTTVTGKRRDWGILAGVAIASTDKEPRPLQLRPAHHQPHSLRLEDGTNLAEPPGVEGYLIRHKNSTSPKSHIYVSVHDGSIFISTVKNAHPPVRPSKAHSTPSDVFPEVYEAFSRHELKRMATFIERSDGCVDLRDVNSVVSCLEEGEDDDGVFYKHKANLCFEVKLLSGGTVRLEASSRADTLEWVKVLNDLMKYWRMRHRVEARLRMDAMMMHANNDPFSGTELSNDSDNLLSDVWDWCVIDGCRPIVASGRLHMKKGPFAKFRSVFRNDDPEEMAKARYLILAGGCLIPFKVKSKNVFHPRKNHYSLFGAYVYSGMLAQEELNERSHSGTATMRVYQDGLQSCDGAEDTTFCVRLTSTISSWSQKRINPWDLEDDQAFVPPPLSTKPPTLLIFRTRSKLERDRWVWAINAEMERQVRAHVKQEEILREYGNVPER